MNNCFVSVIVVFFILQNGVPIFSQSDNLFPVNSMPDKKLEYPEYSFIGYKNFERNGNLYFAHFESSRSFSPNFRELYKAENSKNAFVFVNKSEPLLGINMAINTQQVSRSGIEKRGFDRGYIYSVAIGGAIGVGYAAA
ncbi:MAG: hypothetical protein GYA41_06250 [Bacteroidales bacterium]|nr:hypothetical protein [Bacteroidales bacterium]